MCATFQRKELNEKLWNIIFYFLMKRRPPTALLLKYRSFGSYWESEVFVSVVLKFGEGICSSIKLNILMTWNNFDSK